MPIGTVFSIISFILGIVVAVLQLYVTTRLAKIKEDILTLVRSEMKQEIDALKKDMVTREVLELTRRNLEIMMQRVLDKVDQIKDNQK